MLFQLKMILSTVFFIIHIYLGYCQQQFTVEPSDTEVVVGQTVTLFCTVSDKAGTLTWIQNTTNAINTDSNVFGGSQYSIEGDQSLGEYNLIISDVALSDSGAYQCIVTAGSSANDSQIMSTEATLSVINQQAFEVEPADTNVFQGNTAVLFCKIVNQQGSVQWLLNSLPFSVDTTITSGETRYSIVGVEANGEYNLQIVGSQESDAGSYQCSVTASSGSPAITSSTAQLTVATSGQRFVVIPSDVRTTEGSDVTFRCKVEDKVGVLSWLYNGQPISNDESTDLERHSIIGNYSEGEYNLFISEVTKSESGTYHCIINSGGSSGPASSSPASLIVLDAIAPSDDYPKCSIFPNTNLIENDNVTLLCESEGGDPPAKLNWQLGQSFIDGNYISEPYARNTLNIQLVAGLIGAEYMCRSTHPTYASTKICDIGALSFELNPTIDITIEPARQEIIETEAGSIECVAVGDPVVLGYKWYLNGALINSSDSRFTIETTDNEKTVLRIVSAEKSMDGALIRCEARNKLDTTSLTSSIQVTEQESDLYKYVLAVLCLIGIIILAAIVIAVIAAYCYRKHKKLNKVAPKDIEAAIIVKKENTRAPLPPKESSTRKKRKRRKHRHHQGSKIIEHVIHAEPKTGPYEGNYFVARRDIYDGYLSPNGYKSAYPALSYSSDVSISRKASSHSDGSKRGSYDLEKARKRNESVTPRPNFSSSVNSNRDLEIPENRKLTNVYTVSGSQSPRPKISLSPGEYIKREEYERKAKELEAMRRSMVPESRERTSRKKHNKHKKPKDVNT